MTARPDVIYLADHSVWIAVPAFAPAIVVAGVIGYIAVKNRRKSGKAHHPKPARTDQDGSP